MLDRGDRLPIKYLVLLLGALAVHILLFTAITGQKPGETGILTGQVENRSQPVLFFTLAVVLTLIMTNLFTSKLKALLVYWKWAEPWPLSRAFARYLPKPPQAHPESGNSGSDEAPLKGQMLDALWQQIYRRHKADPVVIETRGHFLLAQEFALLSFLLLIVFGTGSFIIGGINQQTLTYTLCLLVQYITAMLAARSLGNRFFSNVLAIAETHKIITRSRHQADLSPG